MNVGLPDIDETAMMVEAVEGLLEQKGSKENLAFVGDGINDAPVLAFSSLIAAGASALTSSAITIHPAYLPSKAT